jgi:hypothetical protein
MIALQQTIDVPASRRITLDVPKEIPEGKVKVTFIPLSAGRAKPRLASEEALDRLSGMFEGSKFTVDALLEERRRDLEREKE